MAILIEQYLLNIFKQKGYLFYPPRPVSKTGFILKQILGVGLLLKMKKN